MKKLKPHPHVIRLLGCVTESGAEDNIFETAWFICAFITATTKVIIVHSDDQSNDFNLMPELQMNSHFFLSCHT